MNLVDELYAITAALGDAGIVYAVCGGVAVTIHGATRSTTDLDLVVERGDLERILEIIRPLGYKFPALPMVFDEGTPQERHVQRVTKIVNRQHLLLDLLLSEAAFADALRDRVDISLSAGAVSVVSLPTLLRMKRLAGRAQDLADIEKLEGQR